MRYEMEKMVNSLNTLGSNYIESYPSSSCFFLNANQKTAGKLSKIKLDNTGNDKLDFLNLLMELINIVNSRYYKKDLENELKNILELFTKNVSATHFFFSGNHSVANNLESLKRAVVFELGVARDNSI